MIKGLYICHFIDGSQELCEINTIISNLWIKFRRVGLTKIQDEIQELGQSQYTALMTDNHNDCDTDIVMLRDMKKQNRRQI